MRLVHVTSVALNSPYRNAYAIGQGFERVLQPDGATTKRARSNGAVTFHRERAIDGQESGVGRLAVVRTLKQRHQFRTKRFDSFSRCCRRVNDRSRRNADGCEPLGHLVDYRAAHRLGHTITLGNGHDKILNAEIPRDVHMLIRLGTQRLAHIDNKEGSGGAAGARDHRADEPFMARRVDKGQDTAFAREMRVPQGNANAPILLFRQAVSVSAGQGAHEGRLAMIHMAQRYQREVLHACNSLTAWASAMASPSVSVRISARQRLL